MLFILAMFGGLLLMMGHQSRSEALFYYFRLEDQVPENHLLRLIDRHVSFEFVREKLKEVLQRYGAAFDRSGSVVAHSADRLSVRHHQRAQAGGGAAHAPGLAVVHRAGLRP